MTAEQSTRNSILEAAKEALLENGYAALSTRAIAQRAGVPLSQIHYHFGTKQNLVLEVLAVENRRLLERQTRMYHSEMPFWKQWEQACDFLDDDLASGYVRVLQEMTAAGWADGEIAAAVRAPSVQTFVTSNWPSVEKSGVIATPPSGRAVTPVANAMIEVTTMLIRSDAGTLSV